MIDWKRGGWTGSINRHVQREVRKHMHGNLRVKRSQYPLSFRFLRQFYADRTFVGFLIVYIAICIAIILADLLQTSLWPSLQWISFGTEIKESEVESLLNMFAGYAITAQVGVLGVISIAVGLVTLLAQREGAGTEVKVYYHASLAFEVFASCIALLLILCMQILWPFHFVLGQVAAEAKLHSSKIILVMSHMMWLAFNLAAMAHFVAITFRFVQRSTRQELLEAYTVSSVLPIEMKMRMRQRLYSAAGSDVLRAPRDDDDADTHNQAAIFGMSYGRPEVYRTFKQSMALYDVRVTLVRWAVNRWLKRCGSSGGSEAMAGLRPEPPTLYFPLHLDYVIRGRRAVCNRRGGVALDHIERLLLRLAFRFERADEEA